MSAIDATTGLELAQFQRGTPADVDRAVAAARAAHEGPWGQLTAGQRADRLDEVADRFAERKPEIAKLDSLEVGKPNKHALFVDAEVLVAQFRHFASLARTADGGRVLDEGATLFYRGDQPGDELAGAPFVAPTVLTDVDDEATVAREEVFGPVVSVHEFSSTDEVVRRANDTEYGLAAGLWTDDLERAHTVAADLEAGSVWVNNYLDMLDPAPHGGFKQSGIGRELAKEALDAYRQVKTVKMTFGEIPKF